MVRCSVKPQHLSVAVVAEGEGEPRQLLSGKLWHQVDCEVGGSAWTLLPNDVLRLEMGKGLEPGIDLHWPKLFRTDKEGYRKCLKS